MSFETYNNLKNIANLKKIGMREFEKQTIGRKRGRCTSLQKLLLSPVQSHPFPLSLRFVSFPEWVGRCFWSVQQKALAGL